MKRYLLLMAIVLIPSAALAQPPVTTGPLDRFCRHPVRRSRPESSALVAGRQEADMWRDQLVALRSTRAFRTIEPLRRAYSKVRGTLGW